ncbi:MAG: hypothetical protein EOO29_25765 [Comamonadaceae bacterium]|nr:MAG: hypothetical protein EOO29_25765 [Comamonadaceae bacterium]
MNDEDLQWLVRQIVATAELLGQEIKPGAAALLAEDLSSFDRATLAAAMHRVRSEHSGRLTPKVILDRIDEVLGRPAGNEAWALASQALDERATVVWTAEMEEAWAVAQPLAAACDMVGARMAFLAAYERLMRTAREQRLPVNIRVSMGWDTEGRHQALEQAEKRGTLSPALAATFRQALPPPETAAQPAINPVALLAGRAEPTRGASPALRGRLAELRADLASRTQAASEARSRHAETQRQDLAERKRQAQEQIDQRLAAQAKGGAR